MKKRKEMKEEENYIKRLEYIELNKTVRKKIREDIRRYNDNLHKKYNREKKTRA